MNRLSADDLRAWLPAIEAVARQAGALVMQVYARPSVARSKADASPVTEADVLAEAAIARALARLTPHLPVVAEEAMAAGAAPVVGERFWLVDPLDGTKEFIQRNGEFTVNIALVDGGRPVLGVVYAPALERLFAGVSGLGATVEDACGRRPARCRPLAADGATVLTSRSHADHQALDAFLADQRVAEIRHIGSSLKLGLLAAGEADLYPRFGRTMEWDTAAGDAVLSAAGGEVADLQGRPLRYGKPGFENPDFVARGGPPAPAPGAASGV
jgi:3'(2'), 5'-bisphosphate nucleotidase